MRICSEQGCGGRHEAWGLCPKHYQRARMKVAPPCKVAGCVGKSIRSSGYCETCRFRDAYALSNREERARIRYRLVRTAQNARWPGVPPLPLDEYLKLSDRPCHYCGGLLCAPPTYNGIGLDRLDNSTGYVRSNVVPCGEFCNYVRGTRLSPAEMWVAAKAIIQLRGLR